MPFDHSVCHSAIPSSILTFPQLFCCGLRRRYNNSVTPWLASLHLKFLSVNYSHNDKKLNTKIVWYCTHIALQMIQQMTLDWFLCRRPYRLVIFKRIKYLYHVCILPADSLMCKNFNSYLVLWVWHFAKNSVWYLNGYRTYFIWAPLGVRA
jgi:hypothetical protein